MDSDLPFIFKIVVLTLVLPVALAWLASLLGITGIALRSRLRKQAGDPRENKPSSGKA